MGDACAGSTACRQERHDYSFTYYYRNYLTDELHAGYSEDVKGSFEVREVTIPTLYTTHCLHMLDRALLKKQNIRNTIMQSIL